VRTMGRWTLAAGVTGVCLLLAGCGSRSAGKTGAGAPAGGGAAASKLYALVPCGQVGPFFEVAKLFKAEHPEIALDWEQENMVTMTRKVLDGKAAPDAFLSMGDLEMDQLEAGGKLEEGTRVKYAENSLALIVPAKNPGGVKGIADLAKPSVKAIAVPDPALNSAGKHMKEALEKAGIWKQVERKILLPRFAADTKEIVMQGKVEAAVSYYPCSVEVHVPGAPPNLPKEMKLVGHIGSELYSPFWAEGAVIKGARNPEGGKMLLEFLERPQVQEIFRRWEFVREPAGVGKTASETEGAAK